MLKNNQSYYLIQTQTSNTTSSTNTVINNLFSSPAAYALLACGLGLAALTFFENKGEGLKKDKLAKGRWGTEKDRKRAMKEALKQIEAKKHNEVAVCLSRPGEISKKQTPLFLTDLQRGCAIMGGPGTGKSYVGVLPILYSLLDQGLPIICYDFKYPDLTAQIAGNAAKRGYELFVFAPGFAESHVCNPLSFIPREDPSMMAAQFAEVLNRNFKKAGQKESDQFFSVAADQLVQGILMLALETEYPDLIMCQALLSLPKLPERIKHNRDKINFLTYTTFSTLLASASSEKTVASIIAVASNNFTSLMKPKILSAFCGQSTLPTKLGRKQMIVVGLDSELRDVLVPPCATLIDLIVTRNVSYKRDEGIALVVDEAPTINLPRIVNWLNEMRSRGLCTTLAFQNIVQLEQMYGKELTKSIWGGCATKMIYNPQEYDSAKLFSDYLGQEEIEFKQKSRSKGKGGGSTSISDQNQARNLLDPADLLKFDQGERITISPGFKSRGQAYVPIKEKVEATEYFKATVTSSESLWSEHIRRRLIEQTSQTQITAEDMKRRSYAALAFLPLPGDEQLSTSPSPESSQKPFTWLPNPVETGVSGGAS
ncbi:MAG: type IV secretory system conjugative DNA transfer family protein [Microcystaceae cyanobacterium]